MQAGPIWFHRFDDRTRNRLEFIPTKVRRNQDDPDVFVIGRDRLMGERDEIDHVRGNDDPSFSRCVG